MPLIEQSGFPVLSFIIALNSSETDLKQIISLNKELTTTTPIVEKSEQETGEAIENGNLTPLATDIANILSFITISSCRDLQFYCSILRHAFN
jgi:hypothetical protein